MKKKIALFTTGWGSEILISFLSGMMKELEDGEADIFLFLCFAAYSDTPGRGIGEMNIFNLPDLHDFDGAVVFASGLDYKDRVENIIERSREAGIPVILQGSRVDGVSFVGSDNRQAVMELCEHVRTKHGARKFTFFAGTRDSHDSELRVAAVKDYLKDHNAESDLKEVFYTNWENAAVTRRIDEMISRGEDLPDVLICANDGLAMEACVSFERNGINVPGDILVTGFDYIDGGKIFDPSIASVDQCFDKIGEAAIRVWRRHIMGEKDPVTEMIPCRFVPGESCDCAELRDSDKHRRRMGRDAFSLRSKTTYFNRKLDIIDSAILSCLSVLDLKMSLNSLFAKDHVYEGDSFHLLMEPNFELSIYDSNVKMNSNCYSEDMEVIYSSEDRKLFPDSIFKTRDLIPGYTDDGVNHLYVFLPLHEEESAYGYLVFRDCLTELANHFLQNYYTRMCLALEKFRYALTLEHINRRLLDLMGRDPLTNVNNRMAYEEREKALQAEIDSGYNSSFAMVVFDVNNLKMVNDSQGHEAGDEYLIRSSQMISRVFKQSDLYRIGGDEFVVVLTGEDYGNREMLMKMLHKMLSPYQNELPLPADYVSIASGIAVFDPQKDKSVADVIKRADGEMYKDKLAMKGKV